MPDKRKAAVGKKRHQMPHVHSLEVVPRITMRLFTVWAIMWLMVFSIVIFYLMNGKIGVGEKNLLESSILPWIVVSSSILMRLLSSKRHINTKFFSDYLFRIVQPFISIMVIEYSILFLTKYKPIFVEIFICSTVSILTIIISLVSLILLSFFSFKLYGAELPNPWE